MSFSLIGIVKTQMNLIIQFEECALPEAVRAEGMPARKLDRVGPVAQADTALVASLHLHTGHSLANTSSDRVDVSMRY